MSKHFRLAPLAAAMACACAHAEEPVITPPATQVAQVERIVVSGSREATSLRATPAAVERIDDAMLDARRPTFIGQVLNTAPGVYITDLGNEQHNTSIRQPLSYQAVYLYLEDGLPIRPVGLFNHNALYELNLASAGAIEVIKGPASSLYGANSVGGAINLLTAAPSEAPELQLGIQRSNDGYTRAEFDASTNFGAHGLRASGYVGTQRDAWQAHSDADKRSLSLRWDWQIASQLRLKTVASYNYLDTDMPGSLNASDYASRPAFSPNTFTFRNVEAMRLSSALESRWRAESLSTLTAWWRDNSTDQLPSYLIFDTGASTASGRTTDQHFRSLGVDLRHREDVARTLRLIGGVSLDHSPVDAHEDNLAITRDPASGRYTGYRVVSARRDYDVTVQSAAAYLQGEWRPLRGFTLTAGARHDDIGYDYTNHLTPSATTGAASGSRDYSHTSPSIGAAWDASRTLNLYTRYSQGFTPPEVSNQYGGALATPDLRPAVFDNIEAGARWARPDRRLSAELTVYRLAGSDEILSYTIRPGVSEPRNAGSTRHVGVEFGSQARLGSFEAMFSGAWAKHRYGNYRPSSTLDFSGKDMPGAPRLLANAELAWLPGAHARIALEGQHVGAYWMDNANTVRYDGHTLAHLRASWREGGWEIFGRIANLFDARYAEIAASSYTGSGLRAPDKQDTYTPGAPRTFFIGLRYHFGGTPPEASTTETAQTHNDRARS